MSVRRFFALTAALAVVAALGSVAPATAKPHSGSPHYYVSLGDSLAFGFQPNLFYGSGDTNPADYHGYAEDFAAMHPQLTLVNYGCSDETTSTMLNGGCPGAGMLHDSYGSASSQAGAAVNFLTAHPGQVDLISVDIGSNDLLQNLVYPCLADPDPASCIAGGMNSTLYALGAHYATLLTELRAAAPHARIVLFNYYNPLALGMPGSDAFAAAASDVVDTLAQTFHASVADAFSAMNHRAGSPSERAFLCSRTWECTSYADIHPTDLGYRTLAVALQHAVAG